MEFFPLATASWLALGPTQPPIQWVPGTLSLGVKRPEREAAHSHVSSAEVKNAWSYISTPQFVLMSWCLIQYRDNIKFTLLFLLLFNARVLGRLLQNWTQVVVGLLISSDRRDTCLFLRKPQINTIRFSCSCWTCP